MLLTYSYSVIVATTLASYRFVKETWCVNCKAQITSLFLTDSQITTDRLYTQSLAVSIELNHWSRNAPCNTRPPKSQSQFLFRPFPQNSDFSWLTANYHHSSVSLPVVLPLFVPHPGWRGSNCRVTCSWYTLRHEAFACMYIHTPLAHAHTDMQTHICSQR